MRFSRGLTLADPTFLGSVAYYAGGAVAELGVLALRFEDTETFDGTVYTVDVAKQHGIVVEQNEDMTYGRKFHIRCANGVPYNIFINDVAKASDGRIAAMFWLRGAAGETTTQNVEIFNSDGSLGTTLGVNQGGLPINDVACVTVWDANGDMLWADQCIRRVSGTGTGTPNWQGRALAFSPDETELLVFCQTAWPSNIAGNHTYDGFPTTNTIGTQRFTMTQEADIAPHAFRVTANTGAIQAHDWYAEYTTIINYNVAYNWWTGGPLEYLPSGRVPQSFYAGASGYSGNAAWRWGGNTLNGANEPRGAETFDAAAHVFVFDPANLGTTPGGPFAVTTRWMMTFWPQAGSSPNRGDNQANGAPVAAVPLSDEGVLFTLYDNETGSSDFNRGLAYARDTNVTIAPPVYEEGLICKSRRWGGSHGGNNSWIIRFRDNPSTPQQPEIVWAEGYGAGTSGGDNDVTNDNRIISITPDEANNRLFAGAYAKTTNWWTGSRYINPSSVYGTGAGSRSIVVACLDLTDGREIWTAIVQSTGVLEMLNGRPFLSSDGTELWLPMYFEEEAIFDNGLASEQTLTAVGGRRNGYAVYSSDAGVFQRWEEITNISDAIFYAPAPVTAEQQNPFPTAPTVVAPDMFYFSFDLEDKESDNVYTDLTGNSRHATWSQPPTITATGLRENEGGKIGETINLGGASTNYLDLASTATATPLDQWTFSFWLRNQNLPTSNTDYPILSKSDLGSNKELEVGLNRKASSSATDVYVKLSTDGSTDIRLNWASPTTGWERFWENYTLQHLAVTFHASEGIKIFHNGVEVAFDATAHGNLNRSSFGLRIARNLSGGTQSVYDGDGDEFAGWTTRLTPAQVADVYERGRLGAKLL